MKQISFIPDRLKALWLELIPGWLICKHIIIYKLVYVSPLVHTRLTPYEKYYKGTHMSAQDGLTLAEYLEATEETYSAFARRVPCSISYPRLLALGLARPSYEMAVRIEALTDGMVPRTQWYPAGPSEDKPVNPTIEDLI